MKASLRLRFFLLIWPVAVLVAGGLAFAFDRWAQVELRDLDVEEGVRPDPAAQAEAEAVVADWVDDGRRSVEGLRERLTRLTRGDSVAIVVLDAGGALVVTTDPSLELASGPVDGEIAFSRSVRDGDARTVETFEVVDISDDDGDGHTTILLPGPAAAPAPAGGVGQATGGDGPPAAVARSAALRADARRTLLLAALLASAIAALMAVALSTPLVGRLERLGAAALRLREGDLGVRIGDGRTDEIGRVASAFDAMAAGLEEAEAHKRALVDDVAHELRTPLTNLVGLLEAVDDGVKAPDAETIATLRSEAGLLASLVEDLESLSLAESGQLSFDLGRVDAVALVREAVALVSAGGYRGAVVGPAETGPMFVRADPRRLLQAVRNLVLNAATHGASEEAARAEVHRVGDAVRIRVTDYGPGIPSAHLERIWERFHRVDPSRARASGGRGLGLAIVRRFVDAMGGSVRAASTPGEGASFTVELPSWGEETRAWEEETPSWGEETPP